MKVLSLLQPWASLCIHTDKNGKALKQIETRSWNTKYRGELLIHASAKFPKKVIKNLIDTKNPLIIQHAQCYANGFIPLMSELPLGVIIGKVNLIETYSIDSILEAWSCNDGSDVLTDNNGITLELSKKELAFGDYSPKRYAWLFDNPVMFEEPIPAKGQLGLWEYPVCNCELDKYLPNFSNKICNNCHNKIIELH